MQGEADLVQFAVRTEHALGRCQWDEDLAAVVLPATGFELVHTHHLEGNAVHLHPLLQRIIRAEEFLP